MDKRSFIEELISTIESEFEKADSTHYYCEDGTDIHTDVGYVYSWFEEYKEVLRKKYRNK